jgi:DNA-binding NtrC family response regulator
VITRAWVLGGESLVDARHLVFNPLEGMEGMVAGGLASGAGAPAPQAPPSRPLSGEGTLDAAEREVVLASLRRNRGNRTHTARELGIARSSLLCKLKRWGIAEESVT